MSFALNLTIEIAKELLGLPNDELESLRHSLQAIVDQDVFRLGKIFHSELNFQICVLIHFGIYCKSRQLDVAPIHLQEVIDHFGLSYVLAYSDISDLSIFWVTFFKSIPCTENSLGNNQKHRELFCKLSNIKIDPSTTIETTSESELYKNFFSFKNSLIWSVVPETKYLYPKLQLSNDVFVDFLRLLYKQYPDEISISLIKQMNHQLYLGKSESALELAVVAALAEIKFGPEKKSPEDCFISCIHVINQQLLNDSNTLKIFFQNFAHILSNFSALGERGYRIKKDFFLVKINYMALFEKINEFTDILSKKGPDQFSLSIFFKMTEEFPDIKPQKELALKTKEIIMGRLENTLDSNIIKFIAPLLVQDPCIYNLNKISSEIRRIQNTEKRINYLNQLFFMIEKFIHNYKFSEYTDIEAAEYLYHAALNISLSSDDKNRVKALGSSLLKKVNDGLNLEFRELFNKRYSFEKTIHVIKKWMHYHRIACRISKNLISEKYFMSLATGIMASLDALNKILNLHCQETIQNLNPNQLTQFFYEFNILISFIKNTIIEIQKTNGRQVPKAILIKIQDVRNNFYVIALSFLENKYYRENLSILDLNFLLRTLISINAEKLSRDLLQAWKILLQHSLQEFINYSQNKIANINDLAILLELYDKVINPLAMKNPLIKEKQLILSDARSKMIQLKFFTPEKLVHSHDLENLLENIFLPVLAV
ncbi:MAG: hypothetical protein JSS53_02500 [Proteobacteria bacterium]|nr:hypothetical protein [Pseudomonadota bacterium]